MYAIFLPSGDQAGARSSWSLEVTHSTFNVARVSLQISALLETKSVPPKGPISGVRSVTGCRVNTICVPSGDQSASSSIYHGVFVMFIGGSTKSFSSSGTRMMKMSLSHVAAPPSSLMGHPGIPGSGGGNDTGHVLPDAEAWNAMYLPFGDQVAELPRVSRVWFRPSAFIKNRSEVLRGSLGVLSRLLSNTIFLPSGDSFAKTLPPNNPLTPTAFSVSRVSVSRLGVLSSFREIR